MGCLEAGLLEEVGADCWIGPVLHPHPTPAQGMWWAQVRRAEEGKQVLGGIQKAWRRLPA